MILGYCNDVLEEGILAGKKIHSMRVDKKRRWRAGRKIEHARGVRTKKYRCFKKDTCISVQSIKMLCWAIEGLIEVDVTIDGRPIGPCEFNLLAINDGFKNGNELLEFFFPRLWRDQINKWDGVIVHWTNQRY